MRAEFYELVFDAPTVTFHLFSPWRAAELEHRLFQTIIRLAGVELDKRPDEWIAGVPDRKTWQAALHGVARVLKGWQEDADPAMERRRWRWIVEGETEPDGFNHGSEPFALWGFVRILLERGGLDELDSSDEIDLNGFSFRIGGSL